MRPASAASLSMGRANLEGPASTSDCTLVVRIAGEEVAEEQAKLAFATPGVGVAVFFPAPPAALEALAARLRAPEPEPEPDPELSAAAGEGVQHNSARQRRGTRDLRRHP